MKQALAKILDKKGMEGLTLREVARAAKVSHTAPYRHFKDKEDILAAIAEVGFQDLAARVNAPLKSPIRLKATSNMAANILPLRRSTRNTFASCSLVSLRITLITRSLKESGDAAFGALVAAIERCQAAGIVRSGRAFELALTAQAFVHGIANACTSMVVFSSRAGLTRRWLKCGICSGRILLRGCRPHSLSSRHGPSRAQ
ncbi:MAG: TetR/AcrR family transcriptional regulator [Turneriella sp.]